MFNKNYENTAREINWSLSQRILAHNQEICIIYIFLDRIVKKTHLPDTVPLSMFKVCKFCVWRILAA